MSTFRFASRFTESRKEQKRCSFDDGFVNFFDDETALILVSGSNRSFCAFEVTGGFYPVIDRATAV